MDTSTSTHAGASPLWEKMWSRGVGRGQAFDVGQASPTLVGELARSMHATRAGMTALVPGCGRAYDALALAQHGFEKVQAVDLSQSACDAAQQELKEAGCPEAAKVEVACVDFFALQGSFDFIWDCTFLCALDPSVREQWASKTQSLLAPGGVLLTCVFPICSKVGGPPFAMSVPLVESLLETVGLELVDVREDLPPDQKHAPGGAGSLGDVGTALMTWRAPRSQLSA
mmetsp:Transcript_34985/g.96767  ORF Transcript_34985/g.96767 Transcript_34985/m.96767 type:complete len:228 (+) Transcript_34985:49-732(+)